MSHWYDSPYYDEKVPSVTTILNIIDKPFLKAWAAKVEREKMLDLWWEAYKGLTHIESREWLNEYVKEHSRQFEQVSKKAMDDGSWLHNAIDAYWKVWKTQLYLYVIEDDFDPEMSYVWFLSDYYSSDSIKQLAAYFQFMKEYNAVMLKGEVICHSSEGYSGTCDAVLLIDGVRYVMDWKTGDPEKIGPPVEPRFEHRLQVEAYRRCPETHIDGPEPTGRGVVYFRKGKNAGKYCVWLSEDLHKSQMDYDTFLAVKRVYDAYNGRV